MPPERRPRRRVGKRRRILPRLLIALVVVLAMGTVGAMLVRGSTKTSAPTATKTVQSTTRTHVQPVAQPVQRDLAEKVTGSLPSALMDPSYVASGGGIVLLGGLNAADTSVDTVIAAGYHGASVIAHLPSVRHDTAAVVINRNLYVFGGGNGPSQLNDIVRVDPRAGRSTLIAHLPAASSDSTAAAIGGTAYIVGGYTGTRWLDTIVAYRPGQTAHVVAHLPQTIRYAAVTAVGDKLVIAGGSLENGTASDTVLAYTPATGRITKLGTLPTPTTHAAAAAIGNIAYVIGGRGATTGTPTTAIVAIDVSRKRVRAAGQLKTARSDLAAATVGSRIIVAGGKGTGGTVATISQLAPGARSTSTAVATHSINTTNIYAHDGANKIARAARSARPLIYVPNSQSDTVDVIDPHTYKIVGHFAVGGLPQHVVPAWDLKTLYVTNDTGNSLTPVNPVTGKPGPTIPVEDPYNMYFTPDGRYAIVVAERLHRLDFRDAHTFELRNSVSVPCAGVDHMDFSADEKYLIASCEFSGQVVKVNLNTERVVGTLNLPDGSIGMPQDVKLSPDGKVFYVADMHAGGLWKVDGRRLKVVGFLPTGAGVHGLYPSRDSKYLYATNRGEGSISVISFRTRKVVTKWRIPGGGSPDMGGVSADGKVLWVSGRYNGVVYAISTRNGRLLARIPVGSGPHGLSVWPQPGRYSLGHTGILR
ncbi:MAG: beta-propeller repeat-containing protein, partial [Actinomycetia bacterium]|nr:beta-propeller repeat-containing protein [Actinomycetes bacterium]